MVMAWNFNFSGIWQIFKSIIMIVLICRKKWLFNKCTVWCSSMIINVNHIYDGFTETWLCIICSINIWVNLLWRNHRKMLGILMQRMYKQFVCKFSLYWKGNHEALEKLLYGKFSVWNCWENNKSEGSHSSQWEYIHSSHTKDIIYVILWANDNVIKHSLCITLCRV